MPELPNDFAQDLALAAESDGEGWFALAIGLSESNEVTPFTANSTLGLLSPDGDLTLMGTEDGASLADHVWNTLNLTPDYIVTPVAMSAEHRSVLVSIAHPTAYVAPALSVLDVDTGNATMLSDCSASVIGSTDAGYQLYGDCGESQGLILVGYSTGEIIENSAAGVPEPWVWDERNDRFIHVLGDYGACEAGGYLNDGQLVATCELASTTGEFRAGALEAGEETVGEVVIVDGELVPVDGGELAQGWLGFQAFAAGEFLVANQSTTEGDPLLDVLGGDRPGTVDIDSSSVAVVAAKGGKLLVVNGVDKYGQDPRNGPALYMYDPATGDHDLIAELPNNMTYVRSVLLSP
jgi:hypothetical protein